MSVIKNISQQYILFVITTDPNMTCITLTPAIYRIGIRHSTHNLCNTCPFQSEIDKECK